MPRPLKFCVKAGTIRPSKRTASGRSTSKRCALRRSRRFGAVSFIRGRVLWPCVREDQQSTLARIGPFGKLQVSDIFGLWKSVRKVNAALAEPVDLIQQSQLSD